MEHLEQKRKIAIMIAIMAALLFAALNQTIVGTALPRIIAELGGMEYFSWVFTIYMLGSSITAILVGKLSDMYGRKPFILIGIGVFTVGSFLSGLSGTIIQLIIFRGIQGLGAGMIMSTSFTAVGDLFSPRERGRWQGLMTSVFGLASVFGPTLGGWIVDNAEWHWVFWVFLPVGVVAFFLIVWLFPSVEHKAKEHVDYYGSIFLTLTIIPLLLAFSWAGTKYEWNSVSIFALFTGSIAALLIFIFVEKKSLNPVLPLHLFKNRVFSLSNIIGFILGAGMFGAIMYMPFFVQGVIGTSATASGLVMMPMTLSMVLASAIGGQLVTKTGKYKLLAILGLFVMGSGMVSNSFMGPDSTNTIAVINMIIIGLGLGISLPIFTLTIQNAVEHKYLGVATASAQLFRQIGGTVGVAIMGSVMGSNMGLKMKELATEAGMASSTNIDPKLAAQLNKLKNPQVLMDPSQLNKIKEALPPEMHDIFEKMIVMLRESLSYGLTRVFLIAAFILFTGVILTLFLKEVALKNSNKAHDEEDKEKSLA